MPIELKSAGQFSLRELLRLFLFAALGLSTLRIAGALGPITAFITIVLCICLAVIVRRRSRIKRAFKITSLALACFVAFLWYRVLTNKQRFSIEAPPRANPHEFMEGEKYPRVHLRLVSDSRGIVFDVFLPQLPPEEAPGDPWSEETLRWQQPFLRQSTAAYARHFGFEKGISHRLGRSEHDPLYYYGVDHYFAAPHVLFVILFALPVLWPLAHGLLRQRSTRRGQALASPPEKAAEVLKQ